MLHVRELSDLDLQESLDSCRSSSLQCFKRVEEGIAPSCFWRLVLVENCECISQEQQAKLEEIRADGQAHFSKKNIFTNFHLAKKKGVRRTPLETSRLGTSKNHPQFFKQKIIWITKPPMTFWSSSSDSRTAPRAWKSTRFALVLPGPRPKRRRTTKGGNNKGPVENPCFFWHWNIRKWIFRLRKNSPKAPSMKVWLFVSFFLKMTLFHGKPSYSTVFLFDVCCWGAALGMVGQSFRATRFEGMEFQEIQKKAGILEWKYTS